MSEYSDRDDECWLPIKGFEDQYRISNHGRVMVMGGMTTHKNGTKMRRPTLIRKTFFRGDYHHVVLLKGKTQVNKRVHSLVLETFVGPRPEGHHGCHNDGNPENNRLDNLRWDTISNNNMDKYMHGTMLCGEKHCFAVLNEEYVKWIRESDQRTVDLMHAFNVSEGAIWGVRKRITWKHVL